MGRPTQYRYEYKGKLMSINELAEVSVIGMRGLRRRLATGWLVDDAVQIPPLKCTCNTQERKVNESMKKGKTNHDMEALIEKRMLKKELEDY